MTGFGNRESKEGVEPMPRSIKIIMNFCSGKISGDSLLEAIKDLMI